MNLYITHIGVLRQTFALSFSYLVFYFLSKKQNLLAFVFVVFALMMHSSASFLFLFWIAFNITISRKKICLVLLFLVILFCFYNSFIPYVLNSDSRYMTSSAVKGFFSLVGIANTIYTLFLFLIIISLRKTVIEDVDYDNVFFWFALFQIVLSVLSIRIWVLERFNMYLTPYLMVYVTNLIANQMSLRKKTIMCLFTVFTFSLFFFLQLYLRPEWFSIIPYKFIKV